MALPLRVFMMAVKALRDAVRLGEKIAPVPANIIKGASPMQKDLLRRAQTQTGVRLVSTYTKRGVQAKTGQSVEEGLIRGRVSFAGGNESDRYALSKTGRRRMGVWGQVEKHRPRMKRES